MQFKKIHLLGHLNFQWELVSTCVGSLVGAREMSTAAVGQLNCSQCSAYAPTEVLRANQWSWDSLITNKGELGSKQDLSPRIRTRRTDKLKLMNASGDRWLCDQSEYTAMKTKKGASWAHVAVYDKNGNSPDKQSIQSAGTLNWLPTCCFVSGKKDTWGGQIPSNDQNVRWTNLRSSPNNSR